MIKKVLVLLLLAYAAYHTTYVIHEKYPLPYHSDEWDHLTLSLHLAKEGSIDSIRAYNSFTDTPYRVNREPGYHLLIGVLYIMAGLSAIKFAVLVPTVVAFILAVGTLAFVRHVTRSWLAGLIAAVFSLTLKSNVTVLGMWFMVPMAAGIALAPLILYLIGRAFNHKKQLNSFDLALILVVATTLLIHPPSATVYIPITIVYLAYNWQLALEKKRKLIVLGAAGLLATAAFMVVTGVSLNALASPLSLVKRFLYFGAEDYEIKILYSYPTYLGKTIILLAAAGVYHTIHSDEKKERIIPLTVLALLLLVAQYYNTGHVLFSTYRRVFMFTGEMVLILAAVGLYYIYESGASLVRKATGDWIFTGIARITLLLLIFVVLDMQVDSMFKYRQRLYHVIEESDVEPIIWLSENTPDGSVIVATSQASKAITPLSGRHVVGIERTMMRSTPERRGDTNAFFNTNCGGKKTRIDKYGIDYAYTRHTLKCPFLSLVHTQNGVKIYEVVDEDLSNQK